MLVALWGKSCYSTEDQVQGYARYAAHCLKMVPAVTDREYRTVEREMAAEWLKSADTVLVLRDASEYK